MRLLRLRFLCVLLGIGLVPLSALLVGLYWLPAGFLAFVWYGLIAMVVIAVCVAMSGYLARPVRDLAAAFDQMMRSGGAHQPQSRWIPGDFSRVQRAFSVFLKDSRRVQETTETEALRNKQRVLEAERLLQQTFGMMQSLFAIDRDGVLFTDRTGGIIASNAELDRILGKPAEEISGREACRLLDEISARLADTAPFDDLISKTADDTALTTEIEVMTKDTPSRVLNVITRPVATDSGDIIGRLWIIRDCTDSKRLSEKLQQAQKMESMGQLASGIAHDFNNLLTSIQGNLALVQMTAPERSSDVQDKLKGATRATVRAAELVKQLLGYTRKSDLALKPVDLNKTVSEVDNILRHSIDPRVIVKTSLEDELWNAKADATHIEQVILNIALNARDALPETGGVIEISTENTEHKGSITVDDDDDEKNGTHEFVLIRIKDNGHGIAKENQERIFEPFFTTKAPGTGTGLGLAMAKSIVEDHHGWIELDSEEGKGAEFRIFLPRAIEKPAPAKSDDDKDNEEPITGELLRSRAKTGRILVVDDEAAVRTIAVSMLKYLGYTVAEAADGQDAIDKVTEAEEPFDTILLDVFMPRLSGRDTFKKLRETGCETPIVVCSGFAIEPAEFAALTEDGSIPANVSVIQKPYSMDVLANAIANAIEQDELEPVA